MSMTNTSISTTSTSTLTFLQTVTSTLPPTTSTIQLLAVVTPSHSAEAVIITAQSQLLTTYLPTLTICPLVQSTSPTSTPPYPLANVSTAVTTPQCTTYYTRSTTPVCTATLYPLGAPPIPITACDQNVTFSTDHGYITYPTTTGNGITIRDVDTAIQTLTTYYVAAWEALVTGVPSTGEMEVCSGERGCVTQMQGWSVNTVEAVETEMETVVVQAVVTGVSRIS